MTYCWCHYALRQLLRNRFDVQQWMGGSQPLQQMWRVQRRDEGFAQQTSLPALAHPIVARVFAWRIFFICSVGTRVESRMVDVSMYLFFQSRTQDICREEKDGRFCGLAYNFANP